MLYYKNFERAINCLNSSEVSNYQSLSQANFNLYKHLLRINITPKIETYFKREVIPHLPDAWIEETKTKISKYILE